MTSELVESLPPVSKHSGARRHTEPLANTQWARSHNREMSTTIITNTCLSQNFNLHIFFLLLSLSFVRWLEGQPFEKQLNVNQETCLIWKIIFFSYSLFVSLVKDARVDVTLSLLIQNTISTTEPN